MFTSCPICHRQYRLTASQLSTAKGTVLCGYCGKQFNALERLTDKPLSFSNQAPAKAKDTLPIEETGKQEPQIEFLDEINAPEPQFDIPDILLEDKPPPVNKKARVIWSLAVLLLVIAVALQVIWFNRDYVLKQYPQFKPWAEQICEKFQCEVIREYKTSDIKLLSRDVRLHPNYADTLLVNATMANRSNHTQPYPNIQFSLFDTNGKMIASREFTPEEYLDNSIALSEGMPSNQPVHFVLEITGPTAGAVSFEFRFL